MNSEFTLFTYAANVQQGEYLFLCHGTLLARTKQQAIDDIPTHIKVFLYPGEYKILSYSLHPIVEGNYFDRGLRSGDNRALGKEDVLRARAKVKS